MNRIISRWAALALLCCAGARVIAAEANANRLVYLDERNPFYPGVNFPRLATPQWVGEPGVEAVVVLAIDDMREPGKYETFLRPILDRLKKIDGRAPVSIYCNALDTAQPQLQTWLKEGVSFEVHTLSHPCPLLAKGNFGAAASTYHDCVDLISRIPGSKPVAFRMPCCDSMNSPSPRFYAELFNRVSSSGQFLTIDSSVMNLITSDDKALPRELVLDANGGERFRKYFPTETNEVTKLSLKWFGTTIENYPYPYVIGKLCWEFPAMVPSDWEAQNTHGVFNPKTVADWEAALDATVLKQGVFTYIFHPHGWIKPEQLVEFIDYAVAKHGKKVKFLNLREAQERLDRNLLAGQPLRGSDGGDNGVRLLDINNDGYMDVVTGNDAVRRTRVWNPQSNQWDESDFPIQLVTNNSPGPRHETGARFGLTGADGVTTLFVRNENSAGLWRFDEGRWREDKTLLAGLELGGNSIFTSDQGKDRGVRFRDVDGDGRDELLVSNDKQNALFSWSFDERTWKRLPFALPDGTSLVDADGRDNGLRFVDLNADGLDDVLFSNERGFSLHLYIAKPKSWLGWERGWTFKIIGGKRGDSVEIPMITRGGEYPDNGVWFHDRQLWAQNEDTAQLPQNVDRRSFAALLSIAEPQPKSPEEALASMQVRSGFKIELAANEPLVIDPVAFDWGPDGKLWVAEMRDYPLGIDGHGKSGGVIKYLEDTDGDGRYDKATVFLEGVNFPNGVMAWRKGVLVSAAPEIFYAEDSDGDGRADIRRQLLSGFVEGNQQHRINGFEYGLDNWVYTANGGSGGAVRPAPGKPPSLRGHDLRFKPDTGEFELIEGQTQFGRRRDDWGNWFGNENPTWLWHYYLPERYLARNPQLAVNGTRHVLANYPDPTRAFPVSHAQQRFNWPDLASNVTSANSATPYRDSLFGPDFATSVFISEPAQNLVHREVLEPAGASFTSHRAAGEEQSEFLASTDNWFRPTMLKTGPDGALYIADIYRLVIEHPEYFPDELKQRPDLRAGDDQGRIYRVYPVGAKLRPIPRLDRLSAKELMPHLASANGWERDMAGRLLLQGEKPPVAGELRSLFRRAADPKTRVQVLGVMDGLKALAPADIIRALNDPHPGVREFGIRLSEPALREAAGGRKANARMAEALLRLVDDADFRVRFQLAMSLGEWNDPRAGKALARLAVKDSGDSSMRIAIVSSAKPHVGGIVDGIFAANGNQAPPVELLEQLLGTVMAADDPRPLQNVLTHLAAPAGGKYAGWQMNLLPVFLDRLARQGTTLGKFQTDASVELKAAVAKLDGLFAQARETVDAAMRSKISKPDLEPAIRLLGRGLSQRDEDIARLGSLLQPQIAGDVQQAALAGLKHLSEVRAARVMLDGWKGFGPGLRTEVLSALSSRREWIQELLARIQAGEIAPVELGPPAQQQLLQHDDEAIRNRARELFAVRQSDRQQIVKQFAAANELAGAPERGMALYRQHCATCHRLKGEGNNVGPDLGTMSDKPAASLLVAILDPNQAFETKYISYTAATRDGRDISGVIAAETPNSITLRNAGGLEETLLRGDIKELKSSRLSLMPEGFENALTVQQLADLISFIRTK